MLVVPATSFPWNGRILARRSIPMASTQVNCGVRCVSSMRSRGWRFYSVAAILVSIQVGISALSAIGMCLDRPHTHGGVPAPDCFMHSSQGDATAPDAPNHSHHSHDDSGPAGGARVACSCPSDPLTLLTIEIAVVPAGISIGFPGSTASAPSERTPSVPDVRPTPLSPPPRPSLS